MRIDILTIFPEMFGPLNFSIIKRAKDRGILKLYQHNIRDFAVDKHRTVDEPPYGGGPGMVLKPEPIFSAVDYVLGQVETKPEIILTCPQGELFNQAMAKELSQKEHLIIICGHYEGVDARVTDCLAHRQISIGDYILTGGELPAMVIIDSISRLLPGVIRKESLENETFENSIFDYPQYTRPCDFKGIKVPDVLLSGNHKEISLWREKMAIEKTILKRPELLK